ncbi:MAG TPA: addiction module antitoxin [Candidatus Ozemobacteraceae bacterium]|nr:addiction module antitoxin [Candidatus Ozemobacteraceae bacterium]
MQKKLTITINEDIYEGLHRVIGRGNISQFIESLLRPHVLDTALENEYRKMAKDKKREAEALDWADGVMGDHDDESR